jgi:UDP-hydrolysing UDP-N-acetyl-D-glucosamine 2-epimerase
MKSICILITNRTNYSKLKPIILKLKESDLVLTKIVLSSSSIIAKYGNLVDLIRNDGFEIDSTLDSLLLNDTHSSMAISAGISMIQHATYYQNNKIDLVLTVGDRFDMLTPVLAAKYMNIPIFHLQGGEKSGSIDDTIRNLISLCSDIHFVATDNSKRNLINLGINENKIYNFGCTAVEYLIQKVNIFNEKNTIQLSSGKIINLDNLNDFFVILLHPNTTKDDIDIETVFEAVDKFNKQVFLFYPNVDASNSTILSSIQKKINDKNYHIIKNLSVEDFGTLLGKSICFIGNSSSGIRESASFKIPFINIGDRQQFREQNNNTINCKSDINEICEAISKAISIKETLTGENIYYKVDSSELISKKILHLLNNNNV